MTIEHRLAIAFLEEQPAEAARVLELLPPASRLAAVRVAPGAAGPALRAMAATAAAETVAQLAPADAAAALAAMPTDAAVSLLRRMPPDAAHGAAEGLPPARRDALRRALQYPVNSAGALMDPDVLAVPDGITVAEVRVRLRRAPRGLLYYMYVVDPEHRLVGVMDMPELMRAPARALVSGVMHPHVERIAASLSATAVRAHPGWRTFHAMPVVDDRDRLVGAIRYQAMRKLEREAASASAPPPVSVTVTALGELFHLGLAGFVEGVTGVSGSRGPRTRPGEKPSPEETRGER